MFEWWESLGDVGRIFACVAIPSTVILFLQTILMLIGIGGGSLGSDDADTGIDTELDNDGEVDTELDGGLRLFSFRGIIAFLTVLGWVGILGVRLEWSVPVIVISSLLSGFVAMEAIALLFRLIFALQADGTEDLQHALGVAGTVYLRIPPSREGRGKVNIMLDGRLVEKDAVTDEAEMLNYGEQIVVIGISGGTELIVRKKAK